MIGEVIERNPETDAIICAAMDVATNGRAAGLVLTMWLLI